MNSRNHHMFGSVGSYFWSHLAGFRLSFQGELNIVPPRFFHDSHVSQLSASYRGHHVSWEALPACYTFSVTVAPNEWRRVNLVLPFSTCSLLQSTPVYLLPVEPVLYDVNAGTYTFACAVSEAWKGRSRKHYRFAAANAFSLYYQQRSKRTAATWRAS